MENIVALVDQAAAEAERQRKLKADEISECNEEIAALKQKRQRLAERLAGDARKVAIADRAAAEANRQYKRKAEEIAGLEKKRRRLERSIEQFELVNRSRTDGGKAWKRLDWKEQRRKENVLAVLLCKKKLPEELKEGSLWRCDAEGRYSWVPRELRRDRDVLLARLARKDFPENYISPYYKKAQGLPHFQLPQEFHNDKEVLIATVQKYPEVLSQDFFPDKFLDDSDVFYAYIHSERLKKGYMVAGTWNDLLMSLLSEFSHRIRGDKALMLQAAKIMSAHFILRSFSDSLAGDFDFVKELLVLLDPFVSEDYLGPFAETIRADPDIVLAFVQKNGRCLKHAVESLKSNLNIVRAACQNDASALAFAAPNTALGNDKDFLLDVFSRWSSEDPGDPQLYGRMVSATLKLDRELLAWAQKTGNLSPADLRPELTAEDRNGFWMEMVQRESSFWHMLPDDLADDIAYALAIESFCDGELVAEVFDCFPTLEEERSVWQAIIASSSLYDSKVDLPSTIETFAPSTIVQEKALMVCACEKDFQVYDLLDSELQQDHDLVEAAIKCSGLALEIISDSMLTPELVLNAIQALSSEDMENALALISLGGSLFADEHWTNVDIVRAWFNAGGHFIPNQFTQLMSNSEEFGLALAERIGKYETAGIYSTDKYFNEKQNLLFREAISVDLRSNKDFMMKACKLEPFLFAEAVGDLRCDVDLAIVAFGGHRIAQVLVDWLLGDASSRSSYHHTDEKAYNEKMSFLHQVLSEAN